MVSCICRLGVQMVLARQSCLEIRLSAFYVADLHYMRNHSAQQEEHIACTFLHMRSFLMHLHYLCTSHLVSHVLCFPSPNLSSNSLSIIFVLNEDFCGIVHLQMMPVVLLKTRSTMHHPHGWDAPSATCPTLEKAEGRALFSA